MIRARLPNETLPRSSPQRIWMDVLGSLVMLVILNFAALWYLGRYTTNYGYWTVHQKWWLLEDMPEAVDWLILGDSSCNQGVIPAVFESQRGETAMNLCTIGNLGTFNDLWMLEEYLQRYGAPKAVLIVHVYDVWYRDLDPVLFAQVPRPWGFWEKHWMGKELMQDPIVRHELWMDRWLPLYTQTRSLGNILRETVLLRHNPFAQDWQLDENGFLPAYDALPEVVERGAAEHIQFTQENAFKVSASNEGALREIMRLAEAYQFQVYIANSPVYTGLYNSPDFQDYLGSLQSWLGQVTDQNQFMHLIPFIKTFPAELMQNPDHLIEAGAEEYTRWLLDEIARWEGSR